MKKIDWHKNDWFKTPKKSTVIIFTILWVVSAILSLLTMSNFFTEKILQTKNWSTIVILFFSVVSVIKIIKNYKPQ